MLILEHRHGAPARLENLRGFAKEPVTRIKRLAFFVARISPVLANHDHAVHGELGTAERERLGDGRINAHAEAFLALAAEVAGGELIDVERDQIDLRAVPAALPAVSFEKAIHEMLRVGILAHN